MPRTSFLAYMEQKKLEPLYFWNFDAPKAVELREDCYAVADRVAFYS